MSNDMVFIWLARFCPDLHQEMGNKLFISIVEIDLPEDIIHDALEEGFLVSGRRYVDVPGLLRKYYLLKDDAVTGGIFVWKSYKYALAGHADPEWKKLIWDKYRTQPKISYFNVPVVVDNVLETVCRGSDYIEALE